MKVTWLRLAAVAFIVQCARERAYLANRPYAASITKSRYFSWMGSRSPIHDLRCEILCNASSLLKKPYFSTTAQAFLTLGSAWLLGFLLFPKDRDKRQEALNAIHENLLGNSRLWGNGR